MKKIYALVIIIINSLTSFSQAYEIYVSDAGNFNNPPWQILKFESDGSNPQVFINTNLGWPQDILFLENKNEVLISNLTTNTITRHNAATGLYINDFATGISGPTRMKIGSDSLLYVLQWSGDGKVLRYDIDGNFVDEFTNIGVPAAIGMDWDAAGNLYVSSYTGGGIYKFNSSGVSQGIIISGLNGPTNLWIKNNDIFVLTFNSGTVRQYSVAGPFVNEIITGLSQPEGVAFRPNGNILIGNGGTSSVIEYLPTNLFLGHVIPSGAGGLIKPNAVVLRNLVTSVSEINKKRVAVTPTIGNEFTIDNPEKEIISILIFNILGEKVDHLENQAVWKWNAKSNSDGVYFIKIILNDSSYISEKVIVKK